MKTKNTNTKKILIIVGIAIAFFIGIPFGYGLYHGIKAHNGTTGAIQKTLKRNCNCDAQFEFSSFGIHLSKEDGINGETAGFNIKNYSIETSIAEEAARLNDILKNEVEGYNEIDVLSLHFISEENTETVKFKNGTVLN